MQETRSGSASHRAPHPDLDEVYALLATHPRVNPWSVEVYRARFEQTASWFPAEPDLEIIQVNPGGVNVERVSAPNARSDYHIVYLHGGAYVGGSLLTHREYAGRLSRAARATVWNVGYRLAPEHPFPAAPQDALAAYRGLVESGVLQPERTVLAGDSAGGGLVVAIMLGLRDAGDLLPAGGVCLSPWMDLACTGESLVTNADYDVTVRAKGLQRTAALYLAGHDPTDPLASPLYGDLGGLPPLLIQVGTTEALFSDAARFAAKAEAAGVMVHFEPWAGTIHFWHGFATVIEKGCVATARAADFIEACIEAGSYVPQHLEVELDLRESIQST
ncbi:MAG: alpha/beta hydrolase [Acidimicrobiales bacterium]